MAKITSIVYKPAHNDAGGGKYVRIPVSDAVLNAGYGIEGDLKGGVRDRHLNVMSAETVSNLIADGFNGAPGALGEQLIVTGLDIDKLAEGAQLQLGDSARITIVNPRTGCAKLESYQGQPRTRAAGMLGMMAVVAVSGAIRAGDEVTVLSNG